MTPHHFLGKKLWKRHTASRSVTYDCCWSSGVGAQDAGRDKVVAVADCKGSVAAAVVAVEVDTEASGSPELPGTLTTWSRRLKRFFFANDVAAK